MLFHELGSEQMRGVGRPSMQQPEWGCGDPTAPRGAELTGGRPKAGGGRPVVRPMVSIAGLHAARRDAVFRALRTPLEAPGKPAEAANTATARKLLTILDVRLVSRSDYRRETST